MTKKLKQKNDSKHSSLDIVIFLNLKNRDLEPLPFQIDFNRTPIKPNRRKFVKKTNMMDSALRSSKELVSTKNAAIYGFSWMGFNDFS